MATELQLERARQRRLREEEKQRQAQAKAAAREARLWEREQQRRAKQNAMLTELEQARLTVETYQDHCERLRTVHQDPLIQVDWFVKAALLAPLPPRRRDDHEFAFKLAQGLLFASEGSLSPTLEAGLTQAQAQDQSSFEEEWSVYQASYQDYVFWTQLARQVQEREPAAFVQALNKVRDLKPTLPAGYGLDFIADSSELVECRLTVPDLDVVPAEAPSLAANGRMRTKAMPKRQRWELYREHVSSVVLHWAMQAFNAVPVASVLINVQMALIDPSTGQPSRRTILSVWLSRAQVQAMNAQEDAFQPVAAVSALRHHGEFKRGRPLEDLLPVEPLNPTTVQELIQEAEIGMDLDDLLERMQVLRREFIERVMPEEEEKKGVVSDEESL